MLFILIDSTSDQALGPFETDKEAKEWIEAEASAILTTLPPTERGASVRSSLEAEYTVYPLYPPEHSEYVPWKEGDG